MEPFKIHRGKAAMLDWAGVNTDLIIPARYLKRIERTGYGPLLFADKRYVAGEAPAVDSQDGRGTLDPSFPLNAPDARAATILVVGRNFGSGSSREHAVWAIAQAGYRVLIAPGKHVGFADIFEQNAFNNGLLPIELPEPDYAALAMLVSTNTGVEVEVDLPENVIRVFVPPEASARATFGFEIPPNPRRRLLLGLDPIGETLELEDAIRRFEQSVPAWAIPSTQ